MYRPDLVSHPTIYGCLPLPCSARTTDLCYSSCTLPYDLPLRKSLGQGQKTARFLLKYHTNGLCSSFWYCPLWNILSLASLVHIACSAMISGLILEWQINFCIWCSAVWTSSIFLWNPTWSGSSQWQYMRCPSLLLSHMMTNRPKPCWEDWVYCSL